MEGVPPIVQPTRTTPFAVHYEKIRNHLCETATNSANIHSLERKYEHLRLNSAEERELHLNGGNIHGGVIAFILLGCITVFTMAGT